MTYTTPNTERLLNDSRLFLTDGGFETTLFFKEGFDAPEFAAIMLMDDVNARTAMRNYFRRFLAMAEAAGTGYVLDTNTWRGGTHWAPALGVSKSELLRLNRDAVQFARNLRAEWVERVSPILLSGAVGPAGDGYAPDQLFDPVTAHRKHAPQIETLASAGVDFISALTITHPGEAIGIVLAAVEVDLPSVVSFTLETDGRLPTGQTLGEAIRVTDAATDGAPLYYMVNCAHPDHFRGTFEQGGGWLSRIGGIRANASRLSHAELDESTELDEGDPEEFGAAHSDYARLLPNLRVVGGCCGTDHRHVACISQHLHTKTAA